MNKTNEHLGILNENKWERLGKFLEEGIAMDIIYTRQKTGRVYEKRTSRKLYEQDQHKLTISAVMEKMASIVWTVDDGVDEEGNRWKCFSEFGGLHMYHCYDEENRLKCNLNIQGEGDEPLNFVSLSYREERPVGKYRRLITWVNSVDPLWKFAAGDFVARQKNMVK
ncbi:hypothetical protein KBC75_04930 [Candidatus Shapirobacteria bacterium]|nr:hypothetical protein [Candidatus Shapirobacteria bacterium]